MAMVFDGYDELGLGSGNPMIRRFLSRRCRGDPDYLYKISQSEHGPLLHQETFCEKLREAFEDRTHIVVLSDFDMDGIMSGVVAYAGLSELGFRCSLFIPDLSDGYGFTPKTIQRLLTQYPDAGMILTSDVGIRCFEGIDEAKSFNLVVMVTDHHVPKVDEDSKLEELPRADVIVDPMLLDDGYEHPAICGAHVVYQLLQRYADRYCKRFEQEQIRRLRVFAGIGTVADSMPLLYENRQLVKDSIAVCQMLYPDDDKTILHEIYGCGPYRQAFQGLYQCLRMFSEAGTIKTVDSIDSEFFGFYLAPMFNAVKRVGTDLTVAFGVFFGTEADCLKRLAELFRLNAERKQLVTEFMDEIHETDQPFAPRAYLTTAPSGIVGLLAQKLMNETNDGPCIVLREEDGGVLKGSGRSPGWYPFLARTSQIGVYAAGHNEAFGVSFYNIDVLERCVEFLDADVQGILDAIPPELMVVEPDVTIDVDSTPDLRSVEKTGVIGLELPVFYDFVRELAQYKPFGHGFPGPDILLKFRPSDGDWLRIGSEKQHVKILLPYDFTVLCWNEPRDIQDLQDRDLIQVRGSLGISEFRGQFTVQFVGDIF